MPTLLRTLLSALALVLLAQALQLQRTSYVARLTRLASTAPVGPDGDSEAPRKRASALLKRAGRSKPPSSPGEGSQGAGGQKPTRPSASAKPSNIKSFAFNSNDSKRAKGSKDDNDNKNDDKGINKTDLTEDILQEWVEEEMQTQRREIEDELQKSKGDMEELPQYMLDLLKKYAEGEENINLVSAPLPASKLPTVAIIGRPNTGKSTIVNKLTDSYKDGAIVHDEPGITRDRTYRVAMWNDYNFQVIDTGGIVFDGKDLFLRHTSLTLTLYAC